MFARGVKIATALVLRPSERILVRRNIFFAEKLLYCGKVIGVKNLEEQNVFVFAADPVAISYYSYRYL
ncbi:hypothetical protein EGYY_01460 [Eggerthella sp. YY7918]|nr:hypothetical protein EGYY_01460 [Eggerthella sp. YY7918]